MKKANEGRKAATRPLPPLAEACSDFKGFAGGENRSERVYEILLGLVHRYRQASPRPFYAIREVARFFDMAVSTTSMIYKRLHREGVVTLVRSSQTMMVPRSRRPKYALRGVVCMPIWLPGFVNFLDWRKWFSELEDELARYHFVLEPVFYKQSEEDRPEFVDRVLKFNPDYLIWNAPIQGDRMTMQSITDAGVPILTVMGARAAALPGRVYRTSYDQALQKGLKDWKASGMIEQFVIPYMGLGDTGVAETFGGAIQVSPLPYQFKFYDLDNRQPVPEYLESLASDNRTGIFFADQFLFIHLCARAPETTFKIFRERRVMVCRQVTMHSWSIPTDITLDWLAFPGQMLARRIAMDLSESKGALPSHEEVFEAEWRPRTPLAEVIHCPFDA